MLHDLEDERPFTVGKAKNLGSGYRGRIDHMVFAIDLDPVAPPMRHRTTVLGMCLQIDQFFRQLNEILGLFGDQVFDHRYFFVKFLF
jgi:hypothetical protein